MNKRQAQVDLTDEELTELVTCLGLMEDEMGVSESFDSVFSPDNGGNVVSSSIGKKYKRMNKTAIAKELVETAKMLVAGFNDAYTFKNLGGGVSGISVRGASFGRKGTEATVGCFSSTTGGHFISSEQDESQLAKLTSIVEKEVSMEAAKFDMAVSRIMKKHGFVLTR